MPFLTHALSTRLLLVAASALTLSACGSKEDRIESGLKKGAEFVRQSDWDKATVEMRNVLQIDPKNAQAYLIAARVSEGQREPRRAYSQYVKALELKPDLLDAKTGLARLYLLSGELANAETSVKDVLAADPKNAVGRTLQAALLAGQGKTAEAAAIAKDVLAAGGAVPADTSLLLAGLHANSREWPQALAVIESALKADPRNIGLLRAAVEVAAANPLDAEMASKASSFFQRATAEAPKNHDLWLAWARYHLSRKETDTAEKVMRDAIKAQPEEGKRALALMDFLLAARGADVAEKQYLASIAEKPRDMALRFGLVNLYRSANRPADAQKVLQDIIDLSDDVPNTLTARNQLAGYHLAAGKTNEAGALLAEVLKANPRDNTALVLRGRLHLLANAPRDAVADLRGALRDQPGSVEIVQLLAEAHRMAGEPQLAREALAEASKARPQDANLRALLAVELANAKEFKAAHAELDSAIKALPQATRLYELKAQMALSQKDFALAQKTLEQLKAQQPQNVAAYLRLGQLHTAQNRLDAALKEYDAAAAAVPADASSYIASVGLLIGAKRFDEVYKRIEARQKGDPKNVLHYQLLGETAIAQRDLPAAEQAYRRAIGVAPGIDVGYINTARVLGLRNDIPGAVAVLSEGEKAVPTELSLPVNRAEWLTRAKRTDEAIALYESLLKRAPDNDMVANNLAFLLAEVRGDRASVERALALASRFAASPNPTFLDSLGWIHHKLGQYDKAVPLLEKAVALAPTSPLMNLHLGKALVKSGNAARGKEYLRKAVDSKADLPNLDEAKAMLAQV